MITRTRELFLRWDFISWNIGSIRNPRLLRMRKGLRGADISYWDIYPLQAHVTVKVPKPSENLTMDQFSSFKTNVYSFASLWTAAWKEERQSNSLSPVRNLPRSSRRWLWWDWRDRFHSQHVPIRRQSRPLAWRQAVELCLNSLQMLWSRLPDVSKTSDINDKMEKPECLIIKAILKFKPQKRSLAGLWVDLWPVVFLDKS